VDEDFWPRVGRHANATPAAAAYNNSDDDNPIISLSTLLTPSPGRAPLRILEQATRMIPMKQYFATKQYRGPCTLLPDGNIAIACCENDGLIRIFDTKTFQISFCEERQVQQEYMPTVRWGWGALYYSNGYLVQRHEYPIEVPSTFSVWELEYAAAAAAEDTPNNKGVLRAIHFRHETSFGQLPDEVVVAENGKLYVQVGPPDNFNNLLVVFDDDDDNDSDNNEEGTCQEIAVYDIATGEHIQTSRTITYHVTTTICSRPGRTCSLFDGMLMKETTEASFPWTWKTHCRRLASSPTLNLGALYHPSIPRDAFCMRI
jgi:hypothetical protein